MLKKTSMAKKLMVQFVLIAMIPLVIAGTIAYWDSTEAVKAQILENLKGQTVSGASSLQKHFSAKKEGIVLLAETAYVRRAYKAYQAVFQETGVNSSAYQSADEAHAGFFAQYVKRNNFIDLVLISPKGDIVSILNHSAVLGDNLLTGSLRETQLAEVFTRAVDRGKSIHSNYRYYAPTDRPAMFIATPIYEQGVKIGTLAVQLSDDGLLSMFEDFTFLGKTCEVVLAQKKDGAALFLFPLRNDPDAAFNRKVIFGSASGQPIQKAVMGETGSGVYTDYRQVESIAAWTYLPDLDWGLVVKVDVEEAYSRVFSVTKHFTLIGIFTLFVVIVIAILAAKASAAPIRKLTEVSNRMAEGELGLVVDIDREDELGILAQSFNNLSTKLQSANEESRRDNWLKGGLSQLDDTMRGLSSVEDVARHSVSHLAKYCGVPVAAIYLNDGSNRFILTGGFAHDSTAPAVKEFMPGEGLVGQVAADGEMLELNDVPDGYLKISSGLGSARSHSLLLVPLKNSDGIVGVLEFGAFEPFTSLAKEFLEQAANPLAIAISLATSQGLLGEALLKSQRFTAELQTQQEELQAANEELEEQTQLLKASEEELQAQQEELQAANEELEEKTESLLLKQAQLNMSNDNLEATRVHLEQQAQELQVASRYKSEFLANMSHELRTPLNSLLILSQDLAGNRDENLTEGQVESAEVIYNSGNDLLRLINEVLDLSKIEAGKVALQIEEFPLLDLQSGLSRTFQHMANAKGLEFSVELAGDAPATLKTDSQRLGQILRNLVSNSLKFTDQGSVKVQIGLAAAGTTFESPELATTPTCCIVVTDTGIGVAEEDLAGIFGAFQQGDGSISRQYGGTGLGLTISKELTHLLGGELQVKSQKGVGSSFSLYLPQRIEVDGAEELSSTLSRAPIIVQPSPAPEEEARPAAPCIADDRDNLTDADRVVLIVEDDLKFAKILAGLCHDKGFRYLHAGDGETGLRLAEEYLPMALLLDIRLPGMHGLELLDILKNRTALRHIPVHVISVEDLSRESLRLGAIGFLSKPSSRAELEQALAKVTEVASGRLRNLLIVEDNHDQRKSMVKLIGNGDVKVLEAATGGEALKCLREETVDCMILDLSLPDMSGFELLQQLEKEAIADLPPIIVYTGRDLTRDEEEQLNAYTSSIIIKGVKSPERLLDETALFLHRVVAKLPDYKQAMINSLQEGEPQLENRKILLVDDDMRNIFAISKLLERYGMTVIKAANGQKALDALKAAPDIDMVLMDIMMPVMDGYEAMRRIRAQNKFAKLPILALTAKAMQEDRALCIEAGANDYLAKPVDIEKLISLLRVWLD